MSKSKLMKYDTKISIRYLKLIAVRLLGVEVWFSPPCCNEYFSCELLLSRADLSQLHESHVNKHLSLLTSSVTSRHAI